VSWQHILGFALLIVFGIPMGVRVAVLTVQSLRRGWEHDRKIIAERKRKGTW